MNLEPFTGPGSTPSRRRFWDKVTQVVIASQKVAGNNVSVDEHQGSGTVINVARGQIAACCNNAEMIAVTFADITFCPDFEPYTGDLNGTFVLTGGPVNWSGLGSTDIFLDGSPVVVTIDLVCNIDGLPSGTFALAMQDEVGFTHFEFHNDTHSPPPGTLLDNSQVFSQCGITTAAYGGTGTYNCHAGACCIEGECSLKSEADCASAGGTYQGDDTVCDPNPCPELSPPP